MQCREALDWLLLPEQGFDATLHRPPGRTFHLPAPAGLAKLDVAHRGILFVRPSVDKHCAVQADFPMTGLQVGDLKAKILQVENVGGAWNSADHGLRHPGNDQICIRIVGIVTVVLLMKLGGRTRRAGKGETDLYRRGPNPCVYASCAYLTPGFGPTLVRTLFPLSRFEQTGAAWRSRRS
jgi:hypothetical protein